MRKQTRRDAAKKVLQLSRETVRTLTPEELSKVVEAGDLTCPTGSSNTTQTQITIGG